MELRIFDKNQFVTLDFGNWLIPYIKSKIISSIDKSKLIAWDTYFNETESIKKLYKKAPKTFDIIVFIANNLECSGVDGEISITVSNTVFIPGFDRFRADIAAKLINYGNLEIHGYSIITDCFNHFATNIDDYVKSYYILWGCIMSIKLYDDALLFKFRNWTQDTQLVVTGVDESTRLFSTVADLPFFKIALVPR
mgnify:CR=1 FL=1